MNLPPVFSRLSGTIVSQLRDLNWKKKKQILEFSRSVLMKISWKSPRVIGGSVVFLLLISGLTYYLSTTTAASVVIINGQNVGLVRNVNSGKTLVDTILKEQGKPFGLIAKTHDQIAYQNIRVNHADYLRLAISQKNLEQKIKCYLDGYDLEVNGSVVAVLPTKDDVNKVLKQYQDYYVKPSSENKVESINFFEKTNGKQVEVPAYQMKLPDEVFNILLNGESTTKDYTVQPNDSWWLIARNNNMLTDEVVAGNPGSTKDSVLKLGQTIKLVNIIPYLTVVSQGTFTGTEVIPYDVQTKIDNSLSSDRTKVVTKGSNGSKLVTYSYVQQNGLNIKQVVLKEEVIQAPVTQVIAKGPSSKHVQVAFNFSRGSSGSSGIVNTALSLLGKSYVFGGTSTSGFDCSGFTKYVFAGSGISLPRTSYEQFASGTHVSIDQLQPGDLLFFSTYSKGASHVGIYIGGGRFVHAANPSSGVVITSLNSSYYSAHYLGARRY
jgi:cell wall-associated NlpC family hydrolase